MKKTNKLLGTAVLVGFLSPACDAGPVCKELGRCGGEIVGAWAKKPDALYCQEQVYHPPAQFHLPKQDLAPARMAVAGANDLELGSEPVNQAARDQGGKERNFFPPYLPLSEARAVYRQDGKFDIGFSRRAR